VWTHDAAGNHAVSLEGSAGARKLSPGGKRLYDLLRKSSSSNVSELWRRDLASGKSDAVLTGQRIADYDKIREELLVTHQQSEIWNPSTHPMGVLAICESSKETFCDFAVGEHADIPTWRELSWLRFNNPHVLNHMSVAPDRE
jgi:hypothetical protein